MKEGEYWRDEFAFEFENVKEAREALKNKWDMINEDFGEDQIDSDNFNEDLFTYDVYTYKVVKSSEVESAYTYGNVNFFSL
jgi:hypothetical protein